jgi:L-ascorbate metabolism protein UlaG (beta-lactamase superfamily)
VEITKFTHACVRVESGGRVLVIDPGIWSEPEALAGADAVLVTHEHPDHIDAARLATAGVPVHAPADADIQGLETTPLRAGDEVRVAGFRIAAVGGRHAFVHEGRPDIANLGYLVDGGRRGSLYHPGDSLHVPGEPVETLLLPINGPWMKLTEALRFLQAVSPARAYGIHDGLLNDRGLAVTNAWFTRQDVGGYRYLAAGQGG